MGINFFSIAGLTLSITCFFLTAIILTYGKTTLHRIWALFNITVGLWGVGAFFIGITTDKNIALIIWRVVHVAIAFIPIFMLHVVYKLCDLHVKKLLRFAYIQGIFFSVLSVSSNLFIPNVRFAFNEFYYDIAGLLFHPFFAIWGFLVIYSHFKLFTTYYRSHGKLKNQILYLLLGSGLGFSGGITNFLPALGINIYPFGNFTIPIYCFIATYAILKHQLLDIRIAVTRVGIFIFVYSLVLGLPFWLGYTTKSWFITGITMLLLASSGPFIYNRLRQGAEQILLKDQIRYQKALVRLSQNMHQVKELNKLLKLILIQVTRHLRLRDSAIYLFDSDKNAFVRKAAFPEGTQLFKEHIPASSDLIIHLKEKDSPLLADEIPQQEQTELLSQPFSSGMVVPCTTRDDLVSFIALGPKPKELAYNELDINAFRLLSLHAGLAIENCRFWGDEKTRIAREERIRRYQTMDNFSASLAHEIDNPLTGIQGQLMAALSLLEELAQNLSPEIKSTHERLQSILKDCYDNCRRIAKLTGAVRQFTKGSTDNFTVFAVSDMLDEFLPMIEAQLKYSGIEFSKTIEPSVKIEGNPVYLADALLNLTTNAVHAILYGNETTGIDNSHAFEIKEKRVELKINRKDNSCLVTFKDSGCGIPDKLKEDIFLDFVTTKASTIGTGMGLSHVRKIVEMHKGKVWYKSEGRGKGTTFFIELPLTDKPLPEKPKRRKGL